MLIAVVVTNNTLANTNGANVNVGSTGQTPLNVFSTLVGYLVTLANFVGIIILLAIVVVVIAVLYLFFRPGGGGGISGM